LTEIGYFILGTVAGVLSGLFGIGGGIVMVPSLIAFFGLDILDANSTSLTAMLLPVSILGVVSYYKAGYLHLRDASIIAAGLFVGSFFGGELAVNINEQLLAFLYIGILLYVAFGYLDVYSRFGKKKDPLSGVTNVQPSWWAFLLLGIGAGVFAGLFGKGGGLVIVPVLISLFHYDTKTAAATSLAALQLPVGLPSVVIYAQNGHLHLFNAAIIAVGIIIGAAFGSKIAIKLSSLLFKKLYAFFLLAVAVYMIYKYI